MDIRTLSIVRHNMILSTRKTTKVRLLVSATLLGDLHAIRQRYNLAFVPSRYRTSQQCHRERDGVSVMVSHTQLYFDGEIFLFWP